MPKYKVAVMLMLKEFEADSKDDAVQYAYEEYMNMTDEVTVYAKEVE